MSISAGKNITGLIELVSNAQQGKVGMFASPKGNVAIISWDEYERLTKLAQPPQKRTLIAVR